MDERALPADRAWPTNFQVLLALAAVVAVVYGRSISFGFAGLDDTRYVVQNRPVLGGLSIADIRWAFTTLHAGMYLPLTWLSLMADTSLYGDSPGGYRLTNLLLHAANAFLLFRFLDLATASRWRSLFVAALFAVHPLHVESVVWIAERKDVLSIFFGLLALNAYVRFAQGQSYAWLAVCWVLFVGSLLAKQTLVTFPFLLLLLDYWPFGRLAKRLGPAVLEKSPFFAVSVLFSWLIYYAQSRNGATTALVGLSLSDRLANAVAAYGHYLLNVGWPLQLAFFYPYPGYSWGSAPVLISLAVLLTVTLIFIANMKGRPPLFVGWFWFLGTLVPMIGLVQVGRQGMADRFVYFPMIGIYVVLAWSLPRRLVAVLAPGLVAACGMVAFVQVGFWKDNDTLFARAIAVKDNESIRGYFGSWLLEQGRLKDALVQFRKAVELAPQSDFAHERLGVGLAAMGREPEAIHEFKCAIAIRNDQPAYYTRLAAALAHEGKDNEAADNFARAVQLMPELSDLARKRAAPQIDHRPGS